MRIKVLLISVFVLLSVKLVAQPYRAMLAHFNEWHVTNCDNGCLTDVYWTDKDTIVDSLHYHVLDGYHYISRTFLLREDTTERRVYLFKIDDTPGSKGGEEYLLYDFGLAIGDSVEIHNPISPLPQDPGYFKLDSIVPKTMIDGQDYNFFYLHSLDTAQSYESNAVWVEGIGSLALINTPGSPPALNGHGQLSCFFYDLTLHYQDLDSINACVQVHTDLSIDAVFQLDVKLYPNPAKDQISIVLDAGMKHPIQLKLIDISGKLIEELTIFPGSNTFNTAHIERGTYFVQMSYQGLIYKTEKLILH